VRCSWMKGEWFVRMNSVPKSFTRCFSVRSFKGAGKYSTGSDFIELLNTHAEECSQRGFPENWGYDLPWEQFGELACMPVSLRIDVGHQGDFGIGELSLD